MLVRIIREATGPNPDFDRKQPRDLKTNWPTRTIPVGTEINDPKAYLLCVPHYGQQPLAEPLDDEAKARVEQLTAARKVRSRDAAQSVKFPEAPTRKKESGPAKP